MAEWVIPLISGGWGIIGAGIGAAAILITKRLDPEYRRYLDEKRRDDCDHIPVESGQIDAFCEKCKKTLTKEDVIRLQILRCGHYGNTDILREDEHTVTFICTACGRLFEGQRQESV